MATGRRNYTVDATNTNVTITATLPALKDAMGREYTDKKGQKRRIVILNDAGWSEDTGLSWDGYPVRARVSLTISLDGPRTKNAAGAFKYGEQKPADKPATVPQNGPMTGKTASA
jgi:hypothetical protein